MFKLTPYNRSVVRRNRRQQSLSDLADDFFGDDFFPMISLRHDTFKIDVKENDNEFIIEADVPGIKREEIKIDAKLENGILTIRATKFEFIEKKKMIEIRY